MLAIPGVRSVLGMGMLREPEPLEVAPGVLAAALLVEASAGLCACFSGDVSSSMIGLCSPSNV